MKIKETLNLAIQNHRKNDLKLAAHLYKKVLAVDPHQVDAIFYLATIEVQQRNFIEAKKLYENVIRLKPNHSPAHANLGATIQILGNPKEARILFEKAIEIEPNNSAAHNNLGAVLKDLGELQLALRACKRAIEIQPDPSSYKNLGLIYQELGEINKAIECYKKIAEMIPNSSLTFQNLGNLSMMLGDNPSAINYYEKALTIDENNLSHYYNLYELKKDILDQRLIKKINEKIKTPETSKKNIAYGNFLLANHKAKEKNYEAEIKHLIEAHKNYFESENKRYQKEVEYWLKILPKIKELTNLDKIDNKIIKRKNDIKPIFIIGVPRCGSTIVEKIITSGEQKIHSGEETGVLTNFIKQNVNDGIDILRDIENFEIKLYHKFEDKGLLSKESKYYFTDKSLENFFYLELIKKIYPNAKVINCKRNSLSSIISILKNNLPGMPWAHSIENIFKYFDIYYNKIDNFNKAHPNFIYELNFEKLSNDPEKESKMLMKYCEIPWSNKCLEFYKKSDLISKTTSNLQIRSAIFKHSPNKHLFYKKYLDVYGNKYSWFKQR